MVIRAKRRRHKGPEDDNDEKRILITVITPRREMLMKQVEEEEAERDEKGQGCFHDNNCKNSWAGTGAKLLSFLRGFPKVRYT
jgi:hypothetical protein